LYFIKFTPELQQLYNNEQKNLLVHPLL